VSATAAGIDQARLREIFITEARELVATIERGALTLEQRPGDSEQLNEVFRAAHSLKGAAAVCGFLRVGELTHELETMLDMWRSGELKPDARHFSVMLRSADVLAVMIDDGEAEVDTTALRAELVALYTVGAEPSRQPSAHAPLASAGAGAHRIVFTPQPDAFQFGGDPLLALRELKSLAASWQVAIDVACLPSLAALQPESSYFSYQIELSLLPDVAESRLHEALSFFDGYAAIEIKKLEPAAEAAAGTSESSAAASGGGDAAPKAAAEAATIRVTTDKVDRIIDLMGELVISHSAVRELARKLAMSQAPALQEAVLLVDRHLRELQERVMSVRMVPVSSTFSRLPRMVRDLSKKLDKNV
jgi:two-component system chemotaxis sensor kinase CheA